MDTILRASWFAGRSRTAAHVASALRSLLTWSERARQRRALLALDDRLLKDIGLSRSDVAQECMKPFWRG
jgi:uncharacterized protein YjiS (DUF1127 family)